MKLADYRKKRDPNRTPEPFGKDPPERAGPTRAGAFVVHLHDATRRHYDLRLEVSGVLASFAVPRGPSLDPAEKRLAVRTEDHPIEYLDFEAVVPEKSYGAGPMILWDRGRARYPEGAAEEGLERGKLDVDLEGLKIRGRFALVRMRGGDEWLLLKRSDAFASPGGARDPVRDSPRSVLSGLTVEELAAAPRIGAELEARAAALGAPVRTLDARRTVPMACALEGAPATDPAWIYELKLDGMRALAIKEQGKVVIVGRKLHDVTASYPEVLRAVLALPPARVVLDGELVAFDAAGKPSFPRLSHRIHLSKPLEVRMAAQEIPVVFVAFDALALGERDLTDLPLTARKSLLHALLPAPGVVRALDHLEGDARPLLAFCEQHELEGVVAKRAASRYQPGPRRTTEWVKMKRRRDDDFVVVGYTTGAGARARLGALDLATVATVAGEAGTLRYRGRVGSGLDGAEIDRLLARLAPLVTDTPQATGELVAAARGRVHVRPEIVVRVRHDGWSEDGNVLHGVYAGLRGDVVPSDCTAGPSAEVVEGDAPPPERAAVEVSVPPEADVRAEPSTQVPAISNPNKVLWPGEGITKADLVGYYRAIAAAMLPYLKDRPVMLVRYPDGIAGKSFYQWNVPVGTPSWIRTLRLKGEFGPHASEESSSVFLVEDERTLAHVANLAAIPIHVLASRAGSLDACDFLTIDFDVKGASLREGIVLALALRDLCDAVGLPSFPKTSGQSGLHVFVPLGPGASYDTARALAEVLGRMLCDAHPTIATMERVIAKRGPRVYVDTGQTGPTRTIVAPWSVRAYTGARVSTPLAWGEVTLDLDPGAFTIRTAPERFRAVGDPMAGMFAARPDVATAVARLGERLRA
jgi:bifunctional non-homologous end joining protein LigD